MQESGALSLADNITHVQERIAAALRRAGRTDEVTTLAVTKQVPIERIAEAYRAGLRHFGENRVQEFEDKRRLLVLPSAIWHMIGHLQSNKAARATELFDRIDSLDSANLASKLNACGGKIPVLIQVHLGDEPSKHGVDPGQVAALVEQAAALPNLAIQGLMTIPPFLEPAELVRPYFRRLRELANEISRRRIPDAEMTRLSMGMSHDFEVAIEEGATEIRLGTLLFGPPRPPMTSACTRLRVKVTARARRNEISGFQGDVLRVKVIAPPVEGKANAAVVELLAAHLRVPKSSIRIVSGEHAPLKLIEVTGLECAAVVERLRLNAPE